MNVILLEKIPNLGNLGDLVSVKGGYARNFLVPHKKAVFATSDAQEKVDNARRELATLEAKRLDVAQAKAALAPREVSLTRLCNSEGHLFGSVSVTDVAEVMSEAGQPIGRSEVYLSDGAIKEAGSYAAEIILHPDVRFDITIHVVADESEVPEGVEMAEAEEVLAGFELAEDEDE